MIVRGGVDFGRGSWPCAEHAEERHHDDRLDVDVAEAPRSQVARHPPPAPVEQRRGLGPEGRVLERGIDPDAQHRRLVRVRGVVAAQPSPQDARPRRRRRAPQTSGISDHRRAHGVHGARGEHRARAGPCCGSTGRTRRGRRRRRRRDRRRGCCGSRGSTNTSRPDASSASSARLPAASASTAPSCAKHLEHLGAELERRRWRTARVGGRSRSARTPNNVRCSTSVKRDLDALARIRVGPTERSMPADVERVVQALEQQPDHRVELPGRQRRRRQPRVDPRDGLLARVRARPPRARRRSPARGRPARSARGSRRSGRPRPASRSSPRGRG